MMNNSLKALALLPGLLILPIFLSGVHPVWGQVPAGRQSSIPQSQISPSPVQEMPVRGGSIVVKVAAFDPARQEVLAAAAGQGAELLAARTLVDSKGRKHGWLAFRLPASRLPALLGAAQNDGRLLGESIATTDHASEYEELARRIIRLQQHEVRLSGILQSGHRLRGGDLLYVQERLFRASVDESLLAQRRADIERDTQVNTVRVELFEAGSLPAAVVPPSTLAGGFAQALTLARAHWERLLGRGATGGAYLLVYLPLWLPGVALALLLGRFLWTRRRAVLRTLETGLRRAAAWRQRLREARELGTPY